MARVNITVPDELLERARAAAVNISRLASAALIEELDRKAKISELDSYLAELEAELGPIPPDEAVALLRACQVRDVTEHLGREAARLRAATGRAGTISATDAIVAAFADSCSDPIVITSDPDDLGALVEHAGRAVAVSAV